MNPQSQNVAVVPETAQRVHGTTPPHCSSFLDRARAWQKQNPEWQLLCDMGDTSHLYERFADLPPKARMSWGGKYREKAEEMWEEYGTKRCKVERRYLTETLQLVDEWPMGQAMTVYRTNK